VKGLYHVVRLGQRLADAVCEDDLAIGKMADDLANAPLAGRGCLVDLRIGEAAGDGLQLHGRFGDDVGRILFTQKGSIGIHLSKLPKALEWTAGAPPTDNLSYSGFNSPRIVGISSDTVG